MTRVFLHGSTRKYEIFSHVVILCIIGNGVLLKQCYSVNREQRDRGKRMALWYQLEPLQIGEILLANVRFECTQFPSLFVLG